MQSTEHTSYIRLAQLQKTLSSRKKRKTCNTTSVVKWIIDRDDEFSIINYKCPYNSPVKKHSPNWLGYTPLHFAAENANEPCLKFLLFRGADISAQNKNNFTPLRLAIERSWRRKLRCLDLKDQFAHPIADLLLNAQIDQANYANLSCKNGISHLHIACMLDHEEAVQFFLEAGAPVNLAVSVDSPNLPGFTPLHFAVRYCALESVKVLLNYGADINIKDAKGWTPLHTLLERKMEMFGDDRYIYNDWYGFPLRKDAIEEIQKLLLMQYEGSFNEPIDDIGLTRLHMACITVDKLSTDSFEHLLTQGFIDAFINTDSSLWPGYTALHFAAHFSCESVMFLVKNGANILAKDVNGITPLDTCLQKYSFDSTSKILSTQDWASHIQLSNGTKLLDLLSMLDKKFDENTFSKATISANSPLWPGSTPLHLLIRSTEKFKIADRLYEHSTQSYCDELNEIWNNNHEKFVAETFLLKLERGFGTDITIQDADGLTALHLAQRQHKKLIVNALFQTSKIIANPSDQENISHFHIVCALKDEKIVDKFLRIGVEVNSRIKSGFEWPKTIDDIVFVRDGSTPLHISVAFENPEVTKLLLEHGADPLARDSEGLTPVHLIFAVTSKECCLKMADLLLSVPKATTENCLAGGGLSHFHVACFTNKFEIVKAFLQSSSIDINAPITFKKQHTISASFEGLECADFLAPFDGYTPLHFAVEGDSLETIKELLIHGADICAINAMGFSPMHLTLRKSTRGKVKKILKIFYSVLIDAKGNKESIGVPGLTPLHLACALLDINAMKRLLNAGAEVNACVTPDSWMVFGNTPLHFLFNMTFISKPSQFLIIENAVKLLLKHGADVTIKDDNNQTPIFKAVGLTAEAFKMLFSGHNVFSVNPSNDEGLSHFHVACESGDPDIVENFLKHGVDVNHPNDFFAKFQAGYSPLHLAVVYRNDKVVDVLLKYGADVTAEDAYGYTPLHLAAERAPNTHVFDQILNADKTNINAVNIYGQRPLQLLDRYLSPERTELFLSRGVRLNVFNPVTSEGFLADTFFHCENFESILKNPVDLKSVDQNGFNAIHNLVACRRPKLPSKDYADAIELLLQLGCDLDAQNKEGRTALHVALKFKNMDGFAGLLMAGADINITNKYGRTPLAYAIEFSSRGSYGMILPLMRYIYKLNYLNLNISESNKSLYNEKFPKMGFKEEDESIFSAELNKMRDIKITNSFTLADFLSEEGVLNYSLAPVSKREAIDEIIKSTTLLNKFPALGCFLKLLYRKALIRLKMIQPAINALEFLTFKGLPYICTEAILRFLKNEDLKNLIAVIGNNEPPRKRLKTKM